MMSGTTKIQTGVSCGTREWLLQIYKIQMRITRWPQEKKKKCDESQGLKIWVTQ